MEAAIKALDSALAEVSKAHGRFARKRSGQIRSGEDLVYLKSVCYAWFKSHRGVVAASLGEESLREADDTYRKILEATGRASARLKYVNAFKDAKALLTSLRSDLLTTDRKTVKIDTPPDFSPLAPDPIMQRILLRRWQECQHCLTGAPLAATVMMGGLLEALFVAHANRLADKSPLFSAAAAPTDPKTKKVIPLTKWTLRPYLDVGHELGWITKSGKDVAVVLRDYRNYVHPEKERSHGVNLSSADAGMFWAITVQLTNQLLGSAK